VVGDCKGRGKGNRKSSSIQVRELGEDQRRRGGVALEEGRRGGDGDAHREILRRKGSRGH